MSVTMVRDVSLLYLFGEDIHHAWRTIESYVNAIPVQHGRVFEAWRMGDFHALKFETHFLLTAICVIDRQIIQMRPVTERLGLTKVETQPYVDARNHFEHLEDRLFGNSKRARNHRPKRTQADGGNLKTVHYGFDPNGPSLKFGDRSVEISKVAIDGLTTSILSLQEDLLREAHAEAKRREASQS